MEENSLRPEIRFKGINDDWEQRKLGDMADIIGGGTPSTSVTAYWDGDIDWYAPAELADQIYVNSSQRKLTKEGFNNSSAKMLPVGTVLFTSRAGIGKTAILSKEACTNQGFQSIVPHKDELDSYFIFTRTEELKQYGEIVGGGSTFVEVSGKQMANMSLLMPKDIAEQRIIGNLFEKLDNAIILQQRKLEKLKIIKEALIIKMFPQDGNDIPEIRFKKFTGPWKKKAFQELFVEKREKTTVENEDVLLSCAIEGMYLNSELFSHFRGSSTVGYVKVKKNDLVLSAQNLHLGNANVDLRVDHGIVSPAYKVYEIVWCNPLFIQTWVKRESTKKFFLDATTEGASQCRKNIEWDTLGEQTIKVPNTDEQFAIGSFFYKLDSLISLQQDKVHKLTYMKKALLSKMICI